MKPTPTSAVFESLLLGEWYLCGETSVFGTHEVGLEITADGRWRKLVSSAQPGGFERASGWNDEGTWETIDTTDFNGPGVYQLNLHIDGSGTVITLPVFSQTPEAMRLNNNGVFVGDYVRVLR